MEFLDTIIASFYLWGVAGSISVEAVAANRASQELDGQVPPLYKSPFYLTTRALVAFFVAGLLPVMFDAQNAWGAFYLGISAPVVLDRAAAGLQASPNDKNLPPPDSQSPPPPESEVLPPPES